MTSNTKSRCPWRVQSTDASEPQEDSSAEACKEWEETGSCSLGPRCRRLHFVTCMNDCRTEDLVMTGLSPRAWNELQIVTTQLTPWEEVDTRISGYRVVASYSWKNCESPTISVPGTLPTWTSPQLPFHSEPKYLRKSDHCKSVTTNGLWQAVFKALLECSPGFDMSPTELACDNHFLNYLYDFVIGKRRFRYGDVLTYRRFDVDVIEDTMFLGGRSTNGYVGTPRQQLQELTTNFIDDETLPCGHRTLCHHRVVRYTLADLNILLDFEVEAKFPDRQSLRYCQPPRSPWILAKPGIDCTVLQSPSKNSSAGIRLVSSSGLSVSKAAEHNAPLNAAVVLVDDLAPSPSQWGFAGACRLFFTGTQQAIVGHHNETKIVRFERRDVRNAVDKWESLHRSQLRRLVRLIKELQVASRELGGKCALIFREKYGRRELVMYKRIGQELVLPDGVREKCWREKHWRTL